MNLRHKAWSITGPVRAAVEMQIVMRVGRSVSLGTPRKQLKGGDIQVEP